MVLSSISLLKWNEICIYNYYHSLNTKIRSALKIFESFNCVAQLVNNIMRRRQIIINIFRMNTFIQEVSSCDDINRNRRSTLLVVTSIIHRIGQYHFDKSVQMTYTTNENKRNSFIPKSMRAKVQLIKFVI